MAADGGFKAEHGRRRLTVGQTEVGGLVEDQAGDASLLDEVLKKLAATKIQEQVVDAEGSPLLDCSVLTSQTDGDRNRRKSYMEKDREISGEVMQDKRKSEVQAIFNSAGIGMGCKKGEKPESPNQDSFCIVQGPDSYPFRIFTVFDGHGPLGHDVSGFAMDALLKLFLGNKAWHSNPEQALDEAFKTTQALLQHQTNQPRGYGALDSAVSGATATVTYIPPDGSVIVMAFCGDSRAVLQGANGIVHATVDHKPENPEEKARIEACGGRVVFDGYCNHRVYSSAGRGGLNMSRALGDCMVHEAGVSAVPEIKTIPLDNNSKFLVLCSDGVWEFIENEEACAIVEKHGKDKVQAGVEELTKKSFDNWMGDSNGEVSDDITSIVVWF